MQTTVCASCGQPAPDHTIVHYGSIETGYRKLCGRCLNEAVASRLGLLGFEHVDFEPVRMIDARGVEHEFRFRTRLFGAGMAIDALEFRDGEQRGYEFSAIGQADDDALALLGKLIAKMRRALAQTHLEDTDHGTYVNDGMILRGMVSSDIDAAQRTPLLIIDGREVSWDEFGRMVAAFEGWQFKMEFVDRSDEV